MKNTILVIEDESGIRDNIRILLECENYTVLTAGNGSEGIEKANAFHPDLIICDIMMPEMSGYDVLKTLLGKNSSLSVPFIFLTAKVERCDLRTGMELGADDYIFKPFSAEDLLNAVSARLKKFESIKVLLHEEPAEDKKYSLNDKIIFKIRDHYEYLAVENILYISAERQYSSINAANNKRYILKRTLSRWEEMLPGKYFVRIHRSTLINLNYVNKIQKDENNTYKIHLNNSEIVLEVSRRFYKNLKNIK